PSSAALAGLSPAVSPVSPPTLDPEVFAALKELCNPEDPTFLLSIIEQFVQDATAYIHSLRAALGVGDALTLQQIAHTLKSTSAYMGAVGMGALCSELQELGQAGTVVAVEVLVKRLEDEFERVRQALEQACPTTVSSAISPRGLRGEEQPEQG